MDGPARPDREKPHAEVGDILRAHGAALIMTADQARAVRALVACRTAALGGHLQVCESCGHSRPCYNSCRNRHCPKCQGLRQELWAEVQEDQLLPVPYFHLVLTVPAQLHPFFRKAPRAALGLLFAAAAETVLEVAYRRLGARVGLFAVLHTWTQKLLFHPHLHCVVPGGGLSADGTKWVGTGGRFFLPVRVLRVVFRGKLLSKLERAVLQGEIPLAPGTGRLLLQQAARATWVVYGKAPLAGPRQVVRYVSRYTHRIAISNSRIVGFDSQTVSFLWRDRAHGNRRRLLRLPAIEFARRFLWHVLPRGFVRIRHFGLLSNRSRRKSLARCGELLGTGDLALAGKVKDADWVASYARLFGSDPLLCPRCKRGRMVVQRALPDQAAPAPQALPSPRSPP